MKTWSPRPLDEGDAEASGAFYECVMVASTCTVPPALLNAHERTMHAKYSVKSQPVRGGSMQCASIRAPCAPYTPLPRPEPPTAVWSVYGVASSKFETNPQIIGSVRPVRVLRRLGVDPVIDAQVGVQAVADRQSYAG